MDDVFAVRVGHGVAHADKNLDHLPRAEDVAEFALIFQLGGVAAAANHFFKRKTLDVLEGEVNAPLAIDAKVVHRDDVGVLQASGGLRLLDEAQHVFFQAADARAQLLHGHFAAQVAIEDFVNLAHAAGAQLALYLILGYADALAASVSAAQSLQRGDHRGAGFESA